MEKGLDPKSADYNPYLEIEREVYGGKRQSADKTLFRKTGVCFLLALVFAFLGLVIYDLVEGGIEISDNRALEKTVRVEDIDTGEFKNENYQELIASEGDAIDFSSSYSVESVSLDGKVLSVDGNTGDQYVFYKPGSSVLWSEDMAFDSGASMTIDSTRFTSGDYILCWGNQASAKLRPIVPASNPVLTDPSTGLSLIQDPSLLNILVLSVE